MQLSEFENVRKGINCVYYGLFLIIASVLVMMFGGAMVAVSPTAALAIIAAGPLMIIVGTILGLVGRIMCLSVPDDCAASKVIYAAVVCDVAALLIFTAGWVVDLPQIVSSFGGLLPAAASILFLVFLKQIAAHIRDNVSEQRASTVLKLGSASFVTLILGEFLPPLLIVAFLMMIVSFFIYVRLLLSLRESLKAPVNGKGSATPFRLGIGVVVVLLVGTVLFYALRDGDGPDEPVTSRPDKVVAQPNGDSVAQPNGDSVAQPNGDSVAQPNGDSVAQQDDAVSQPQQLAPRSYTAVAPIKKSDGTGNFPPTTPTTTTTTKILQDAAVAAIKELGGEVTFDEKIPSRPLIGVDLRDSKTTDAGLVHLKGLTSLQILDLRKTKVTDDGLEHLKELTGLLSLSLMYTQVTDTGLSHLKGLKSLQQLRLHGTQIADPGLMHLKGLTSLRTLMIYETKVTTAGVNDIQSALPKCKIFMD
jgi:hypothetical protein